MALPYYEISGASNPEPQITFYPGSDATIPQGVGHPCNYGIYINGVRVAVYIYDPETGETAIELKRLNPLQVMCLDMLKIECVDGFVTLADQP